MADDLPDMSKLSIKNRPETPDDYEITTTLGTGTFGRVYLVQSKYDMKYYAMKKLTKSVIVKLKQVEHLKSERKILSEINFPLVVNMYIESILPSIY
jgi:serine/threonine protein kinase